VWVLGAPASVAVLGLCCAELGDGGTVMHATRTPLRTWFWAAYLVATHDPGISAKQLQRQLDFRAMRRRG